MTIFALQSVGTGIHISRGKKNGCVRMVQPICRPSSLGERCSSMRLRSAAIFGTPFFSPKACQAHCSGKKSCRTKKPPPAMKFNGACSLNRNGAPTGMARKSDWLRGRQKFTSSGCRAAKYSNHSLLVTPTKNFMTIYRFRSFSISRNCSRADTWFSMRSAIMRPNRRRGARLGQGRSWSPLPGGRADSHACAGCGAP